MIKPKKTKFLTTQKIICKIINAIINIIYIIGLNIITNTLNNYSNFGYLLILEYFHHQLYNIFNYFIFLYLSND